MELLNQVLQVSFRFAAAAVVIRVCGDALPCVDGVSALPVMVLHDALTGREILSAIFRNPVPKENYKDNLLWCPPRFEVFQPAA